MPTFVYNKLIRGKIPGDMIAQGEDPTYRTLDDAEYRTELENKFPEEADELDLSDTDRALSELADIKELIDCALAVIGKTPADLLATQAAKNAKSGSFGDRIFIETVTIPDGNPWIAYLRQHPDRYPEITS